MNKNSNELKEADNMVKQIVIPFHESMKKAILDGKKICTSRNKRYGKAGDYFILGDNMYFITSVMRHTLDEVALALYKEEGFTSSKEFITMWRKLHPLVGYVPTKKVYVHWFKRMVRTENSIPQKEE